MVNFCSGPKNKATNIYAISTLTYNRYVYFKVELLVWQAVVAYSIYLISYPSHFEQLPTGGSSPILPNITSERKRDTAETSVACQVTSDKNGEQKGIRHQPDGRDPG